MNKQQANLDYRGGNPDSQEAYFSVDISGSENEDVVVDNFIWNRKKSNDNIIDTGQGKGFSFYFARHVFDDEYYCNVYNEQNPENIKSLGIVYKNVIVVINTEFENDKIRIISAWEVEDNSQLSKIYWKNKEKYKKRTCSDTTGTQRENLYNIEEPKGNHFVSDTDKSIVYEAVRKKLDERKLLKAGAV